jgi:EPS-associated MarR family transcriptional regulator
MKPTLHDAQILRDIAKNPRISQREIAAKNGISLGKVNYAIKALIEQGHIKIHNFTESKNKRKYVYMLTPTGVNEKSRLTTNFLKWKMEEFERLTREIEELETDIDGFK